MLSLDGKAIKQLAKAGKGAVLNLYPPFYRFFYLCKLALQVVRR